MDSHELLQMRLRNQLISPNMPVSAADVVGHLGAMQAQDLLGARWAIALRAKGLTESDIDHAIAAKQIVRSWPMRGTLHFVLPSYLRVLLSLTGRRIIASAAGRNRQLGLDDDAVDRARQVWSAALIGGTALTRAEMLGALETAGVRTDGQRGYHLLWQLSLEGVLCLGPMSGKQPTFVLLDEWLPADAPSAEQALSQDEAIASIARRYFASHGPATERDFARWIGLPLSLARTAAHLIAEEFEHADVSAAEGEKPVQVLFPHPVESAPDASVHLLPPFDEYVVGYGERRAIFEHHHERYHRLVSSNGMFSPAIVSDGKVIGTWKRTLKRDAVSVTALPFRRLTRVERTGLTQAAEEYARFLGRALKVEIADHA